MHEVCNAFVIGNNQTEALFTACTNFLSRRLEAAGPKQYAMIFLEAQAAAHLREKVSLTEMVA